MVDPTARVTSPSPARPDDDARLLARLAAGDERALGSLFDSYGAVVYSLAVAITEQPAAAELAVQEAFAAVWREARSVSLDGRSVFAWLSSLVRSAALALRPAAAIAVSLQAPPATRLAAALDRLDPLERASVELAYFGGLTRGEIAQRLGRAESDVATALRTAMDALRDVLAPVAPRVTLA